MYGFKYFCRHLHQLVYPAIIGFDAILSYVENFPQYADAIEEAAAEERIRLNGAGDANIYPGVAFAPNEFDIVGLFDCRNQRTLIPGTGPAAGHDGAPRHDGADIMQQAVYSGHKKVHGVKNLSVQLANGLSFIFDPISSRRCVL